MSSISDGRGHAPENWEAVRAGASDGYASHSRRSNVVDIRRFRVKHALRAIEDALILLDDGPAEGIEIAALERVRDDLALVLRLADVECLQFDGHDS